MWDLSSSTRDQTSAPCVESMDRQGSLEESYFKILDIFVLAMGGEQRRQWHPTPVLLPGKSHGWRSLVGCTSWGRTESDATERRHFHLSLSCTGEGNGNPLQCSCLENPRDGGAWWAAIYGVAQSQTRLKWLSSSMTKFNEILSIKKNHHHQSLKDIWGRNNKNSIPILLEI